MRLSVVFGTRGNQQAIPHLERIFHCLEAQTFQDFEILVVVDRFYKITEDFTGLQKIPQNYKRLQKKVHFFTNLNSDFVPQGSGGASYVRNFGLQQVDTELVQLFDDDNGFDETYLEKAVQKYDEMKKQTWKEVVICSTLTYRDTGSIQNQGFSHYCYWQSRPVIHRLLRQDASRSSSQWRAEIQMFSGNGLLGSAQLFQTVGYDEQIARIAEDMDFTLSLHEKGAKLLVFSDLVVRHYERDKTKLEQARIGSPEQAQQKARNRFLFVYKHGDFWDKFAFRTVGLPWCLVWLSLKALLYGGKKRFAIIRGLFRGCREGRNLILNF